MQGSRLFAFLANVPADSHGQACFFKIVSRKALAFFLFFFSFPYFLSSSVEFSLCRKTRFQIGRYFKVIVVCLVQTVFVLFVCSFDGLSLRSSIVACSAAARRSADLVTTNFVTA
jgi:hypothetical protein